MENMESGNGNGNGNGNGTGTETGTRSRTRITGITSENLMKIVLYSFLTHFQTVRMHFKSFSVDVKSSAIFPK